MNDTPLGDLITRVRRPILVDPAKAYAEIGVRSHGRGVFHKAPMTGAELGSKKIFEIEPGDLVFNIVFAWEGAVAVASDAEQGRCGSHRFPTYRPVLDLCLVEYLNLFFQTPVGRNLLVLSSPGSAGRNRTLNQKMLLEFRVPTPTIAEQRRIVNLIDAIESVATAADAEAFAARSLRAILLSELTSGDRQIPSSYDALLDSV